MGRRNFLNKCDVTVILNKGDVQHLPSSDLIEIAINRATKVVKGRNETISHNKRETAVGF